MLIIQNVFGYEVILENLSIALFLVGFFLLSCAFGYHLGWRHARVPFKRKRDPKTSRIIGV